MEKNCKLLTSADHELLDNLADFHRMKLHLSTLLFDLPRTERYDYWISASSVLLNCGTFVELSGGKIIRSNFCHNRFCPMCQKRRALQIYARLKPITDELTCYSFLHLVLTVRNCAADELSKTIDRLFASSREMFGSAELSRVFKGTARFFEVTYNSKNNSFHPHLHCLIMVKPSYFKSRYYLKKEDIQTLWQQYLGVDYLPEVYISKADSNAVAEIAKYCVKPFDSELFSQGVEPFITIYEALKGRRLFQFFGDFKKYARLFSTKADEKNPDEPEGSTGKYFWSYDHWENI